MIKSVIFDLDNTLYDYDYCNTLAEKKLFDAISLDFNISYARAAELLNKAKTNVKTNLCDDVAAAHNRILYMQNICEQAGKNPFLHAMKFYNVYWDTMLESMSLFDYVRPLLKELRDRNLKIGILTDLTAHIQYRKISKLGIADQIGYLVTSEETGTDKPSEKMFMLMIEKMGSRPEETLMIGDSIERDIIGAKRVGMKTLQFEKKIDIIKHVQEVIDINGSN